MVDFLRPPYLLTHVRIVSISPLPPIALVRCHFLPWPHLATGQDTLPEGAPATSFTIEMEWPIVTADGEESTRTRALRWAATLLALALRCLHFVHVDLAGHPAGQPPCLKGKLSSGNCP